MSALAVLGGGRVGTALAAAWATAGHDVVLGTRDPERSRDRWQGPAVGHATRAGAVTGADVVVNALAGDVAATVFGELRDALGTAVVVDVANPAPGTRDPRRSVAEQVAAAVPDARVVKALNTMLAPVMVDPRALAVAPTAFLAGDDGAAKALTADLLGDLGWPAAWLADIGGLTGARVLESFIDLVPALYARHRGAPFAFAVAS